MKPVPFIQYMRPNGRRADVVINMPDDLADMAEAILARGYRFECEELTTGHASLTLTGDDEGDILIEVVRNGPAVPGAVETLIRDGYKLLILPA